MRNKSAFLIVLFIFAVIILNAQKEYIENNKNYSVARVYHKNYKIIKVNNLELVNDSLMTFKAVGSSKEEQLPVTDVRYISVRHGSMALTYGLIGAGTGLLSSLIAVAAVSVDPSVDDSNVNYAPIIIGFTFGFGALGAIIGAFNYKWKRLYFESKDLTTNVIIYPSFNRNTYGFGVLINF